ncbi:DUF874 domain-containing protein [Thalassococcus sp. S3]|uniref:GumC family protein n=1 Tax=Thalassococcus sp. S3 TaxID=2017482 RepID=UPI0010240A8F|nr:DUF874 domain-containing protein [Thalassococcus sp. S3]QBF31991.1 DUF874 domain-containing protein [Thalassococcus sp. S3]
MGPIYSLDDFLDLVRRRIGLIVFVTLLGCIASLYSAWSQEHRYQSSEVIQIARPQIANELAPSTVAGSSARRLQLIQQQLMTRGTILEVIETYNLFADQPDLTVGEKVVLLREAVRIEGVAAAREGFTDDGTISVLTITAEMGTPEDAQAIASEFAQRTIALSVQSRIDQAQATLAFFLRQEQNLIDDIAALEDEITEFRNSNELYIPGTLELRQTEVATINEAILEIDREKISIQRQLDQVDRNARQSTVDRQVAAFNAQLASLDEQRILLAQKVRELTAAMETSPEIERQLADFDRDLEQLQNQLDVISTRRTEAEVGFRLEQQRQAETLNVIEPAALPDYPITPSRKRSALIGAFASVVVAFVIAFLLDLRKPVIRTAAQMKRETGLLPVVSVPYLDTSRKKRSSFFARRRRRS